MEDTIFSKIIRREIPAEIVYEDEDTLAFMDIQPATKGHTLVIPKKPVQNIFDADDATLAAVWRTIRKIAPAVRDAVGAKAMNIGSNHGPEAGQVVFHLHFHLMPRFDASELPLWPHTTATPEELRETAEKVRAALA
jgi:histidine triad (HIT) family protein